MSFPQNLWPLHDVRVEPSRIHYSYRGNPFNIQLIVKGMNLMAKCKWCGNKTTEKGLKKRENHCVSCYKQWKSIGKNIAKYGALLR